MEDESGRGSGDERRPLVPFDAGGRRAAHLERRRTALHLDEAGTRQGVGRTEGRIGRVGSGPAMMVGVGRRRREKRPCKEEE